MQPSKAHYFVAIKLNPCIVVSDFFILIITFNIIKGSFKHSIFKKKNSLYHSEMIKMINF